MDFYFLGSQGERDCPGGIAIKDAEGCKRACKKLDIPLGNVDNGFACYKSSAGYCKDDGQNRDEAYMVCKLSGNNTETSKIVF